MEVVVMIIAVIVVTWIVVPLLTKKPKPKQEERKGVMTTLGEMVEFEGSTEEFMNLIAQEGKRVTETVDKKTLEEWDKEIKSIDWDSINAKDTDLENKSNEKPDQ